MERKFKIIEVTDVTTSDGKKFKAYKTVAAGGRKMDVRFVRNCSNVPTEKCYIICDDADCNVDTTRAYPILWVKNVIRTEPIERKSNVDDFFD